MQVRVSVPRDILRKYYKGLTPMPPPKTVEDLAREQGLRGKKFDYAALATAVWPTKKDVEEFELFLEDIRGRPSDIPR
jgi:hypothetical protein